MKYQVPQFIEVEDKIFGPLTLKQFIYVAGGVGLSLVLYVFIPWWAVKIIPIIAILVFSFALAFYKVNNKPLIYTLEAALKYFLNSKLYVWKKEQPTVPTVEKMIESGTNSTGIIPNFSGGKLKDIAWNLTVKNNGQEPDEKEGSSAGM